MTVFNPLSGSIAASVAAQRVLEVEKDRQLRRAQTLSKNVAAEDDRLEHQVESTEAVTPAREEDRESHQRPKKQAHDQGEAGDEGPHLDLKA